MKALFRNLRMMVGDSSGLPPLDLGLRIAWGERKFLMAASVIPICLEIISAYRLYNYPISPGRMFLFLVLHMAANTWLLSVCALGLFSRAKGERVGFFNLSLAALKILPKPFICYMAITFIFFATVAIKYALPLLFFVVFLIWAPLFCLFEYCADERTRRTGGMRVYEDAADEDDEALSSYFIRKSAVDLGFGRSARFTNENVKTTFTVVLLLIGSELIPGLLVALVLNDAAGFVGQVVRIVATTLANVLVLGAGAVAFINAIPLRAKRELFGASVPSFQVEGKPFENGLRFEGRLIPNVTVLVLCVVSLFFLQRSAVRAGSMPDSALVSVEHVEVKKDRLEVKLYLEDAANKFRWLDADNFRLEFPPAAGEQSREKGGATEKSELVASARTESNTEKLLVSPENVVPSEVDGSPINSEYYTPSSRPLRLLMSFPFPVGAAKTGEAMLRYSSLSGLSEVEAIVSYGELQ